MHPLKISIATAGFKMPLRESLKCASAMGATGVMLDIRHELNPEEFTESARREFRHLLGELGLQLIGFHFPVRRSLIDPEEIDRRIDALRKGMTFASQFQVRLLTFRAGTIPSPDDSEKSALFRDLLEDLASHGNHVGVIPTLTPSGESPERLKEVLGGVQSGFIGIDCDPTLALGVRGRVSELLRVLHDRITHVQVRDALRNLDGQIRETEVGRGEVDWSEIIPTLQEIEYRGWLTIHRTDGPDRVRDAAQAIEYLRNLLWGG